MSRRNDLKQIMRDIQYDIFKYKSDQNNCVMINDDSYGYGNKTTKVFDSFWEFAYKRQEIFFNRLNAFPPPWTDDPILQTYKFTNVYRATDRVSQYLIKKVIYNEKYRDINNTFFRIILFKIFNKIETWEHLEKCTNDISYENYTYDKFNVALTNLLNSGSRIFSSAYIMPSHSKNLKYKYKHQTFLKLLEMMMKDQLPKKLSKAKSMSQAYKLFKSYPLIGDFLAYQYITDINYSEITNFSESEFVVPGPGAKSGIRKCFTSLETRSEIDIIKYVAEIQNEEFEKRNLQFRTLFGRPLQYIDIQNIFCEIDKYSRVKFPNIQGIGDRKRIKRKYIPTLKNIDYWFPPKWGINNKIRINTTGE